MILIRRRLLQVLDPYLCNTQFGFRPARSTSHAIYLTRRMQDLCEQVASNLVITLLDWEKAFDRLQHHRLYVALERLGVHQHFIDVIRDCYSQPSFMWKMSLGFLVERSNQLGSGRDAHSLPSFSFLSCQL